MERYAQVVRLSTQGVSPRQIAQQLRMARGTVLKYLRARSFPERASSPHPRLINTFVPYLQDRWNTGEHNARVLWRAIRAGFCGERCARPTPREWVALPSPSTRCGGTSTPRHAGGDLLLLPTRLVGCSCRPVATSRPPNRPTSRHARVKALLSPRPSNWSCRARRS